MPFQGKDAWLDHPKYQCLTRDPLLELHPVAFVFGVYCAAKYLCLSKITPQRAPRTVIFTPMDQRRFIIDIFY